MILTLRTFSCRNRMKRDCRSSKRNIGIARVKLDPKPLNRWKNQNLWKREKECWHQTKATVSLLPPLLPATPPLNPAESSPTQPPLASKLKTQEEELMLDPTTQGNSCNLKQIINQNQTTKTIQIIKLKSIRCKTNSMKTALIRC